MATCKNMTSCNFYLNTWRQINFQRNCNNKKSNYLTFGRAVSGFNVDEPKFSSLRTLHVELKKRKCDICCAVNVWLPCPCHVVAPAILQSLIVPLCSPRGCCVVLTVSECNTAKCSFSVVCPPWEAFDQLRCCVCFRVSLLVCSAPWLSGVLSELKPGFVQIVFSRIRRRVHDID